jgi:hypothetical protein
MGASGICLNVTGDRVIMGTIIQSNGHQGQSSDFVLYARSNYAERESFIS